MEPLLRVENLRTVFEARPAPVVAVDDISFEVAPGEAFGRPARPYSSSTRSTSSITRRTAPRSLCTM